MQPAVLWSIWFLAVFGLALGPVRWVLAHYGTLAWLVVPGIAVVGLYVWIRRRGAWKWEPAVFGVLCLLVMAIRLRGLLVVAVVFWAMYALGCRLLERAGAREELSIAGTVAVGLAALGPVLFAFGMAGIFYPITFAAILATIFLMCFLQARTLPGRIAALWHSWRLSRELRDPLAGLAVCTLALAAAITLLIVITPPIAWDPIHMHLLEARYYVQHHAVIPVPGLDYSFYPNGYESFAAMLMTLGGLPAVQLSSAAFFAGNLMVCVRLLRLADFSRTAALVGSAVAATIPALHWSSSVAKNDGMLLLFEWAVLECFLVWKRTENAAWIIVGALVLAAAASVKLTAIFGVIPLAALLLHGAWQSPRRRQIVLTVGLILAVLGSYWPLRTYVLAGSPTYPQSAAVAAPVASIPGSSVPWPLSTLQRYGDIIWNLHFVGKGAFERPLPSPLAFSFLLFAPVWLLYRPPVSFAMKSAAVFIGVHLLYWAHTYPVVRYGLPAIALLFALTAARVVEYHLRSKPVFAAFGFSFVFSLLASALIGMNFPQVGWAIGRLDDHTYLQEAVESYRASEFLSAHAAEGDRVLGLEYYANLYTPEKVAITAVSLDEDKRIPASFLASVREGRYRWLVVPPPSLPEVQDTAPGAKRVYQDKMFAILERGD